MMVVVLEAWEELELGLKSLGLEFGRGNREKSEEEERNGREVMKRGKEEVKTSCRESVVKLQIRVSRDLNENGLLVGFWAAGSRRAQHER